jgi:hypothetical protein
LHALYLDFDFKVGFTKILGVFGLGISQAKSVFLNKIAENVMLWESVWKKKGSLKIAFLLSTI